MGRTVISVNKHSSLIAKTERLDPLSGPEAELLMEELLSGRVDTADIVRWLEALNQRQIHPAELTGFATVMRRHAAPVFVPVESRVSNLIDTCGTGGDCSGAFNISTAAAFVASAALGVRIDLPVEVSGRAIRDVGIGFLFAPAAHAATRHAVPARKQIGKRTVFNLLGPLTNPAATDFQVLGVYSPDYLELLAATLVELGVRRAFVVHGAGGLDEISPLGETLVAEVHNGAIRRFTLTPEEFGLPRTSLETLRGAGPAENAVLIRNIFTGDDGPRRAVVILNAAAALFVSGMAGDYQEAARLAAKAISSGAALAKLDQLAAFTHGQP